MTSQRHLACLSRPLADLQTIKRRFDTTINDVLLAASASALRSLQRERGDAAGDVKAMVPVSVGATDGDWGNKIAFLFLALPCQEPDPLWRLRDVHLAMSERKRERQPEGADAILAALSYAPRSARRLASQAIASPLVSNLTISNIPGPEVPLYLMGCRAEQAYPVVPLTARHGISIGMTSVNGQACFGIYAHSGLAEDADRLADFIDVAIEELLRLCGIPLEQRAEPVPIKSDQH